MTGCTLFFTVLGIYSAAHWFVFRLLPLMEVGK